MIMYIQIRWNSHNTAIRQMITASTKMFQLCQEASRRKPHARIWCTCNKNQLIYQRSWRRKQVVPRNTQTFLPDYMSSHPWSRYFLFLPLKPHVTHPCVSFPHHNTKLCESNINWMTLIHMNSIHPNKNRLLEDEWS